MDPEVVGNSQKSFSDGEQTVLLDTGFGEVETVTPFHFGPVPGESLKTVIIKQLPAFFPGLTEFLHIGLTKSLLIGLGIEISFRQTASIESGDAFVLPDQIVHDGVSERRFVGFIVSETAVTENVHHHVLTEFLSPAKSQFHRPHHGFRFVSVGMKNRYRHHLGDVGGKKRGSGIRTGRCESDLIVHDDMDRPAGSVPSELGHIEGFSHNSLAGERGITMDEHRKNPFPGAVPPPGAESLAPCPGLPDPQLPDDWDSKPD